MFKSKKSNFFIIEDDDSEVLALPKYCEWRNCKKKGIYKAPTSRDQLREFKWFCLEHVKIYNKGWDYFKGRTADEIHREVSNDARWHRPTWARVKKHKILDLQDLLKVESFTRKNNNDKLFTYPIDNQVNVALKTLKMKMPSNITDLKKQYKNMVKKLHPDVNKNYNEEEIKKLNEAYSKLLKIFQCSGKK